MGAPGLWVEEDLSATTQTPEVGSWVILGDLMRAAQASLPLEFPEGP